MILRWPLPPEHRRVTQYFGENPAFYRPFGLDGHEGLDVAAPLGTPVYAAHPGRVANLWAPTSYGKYIELVETEEEYSVLSLYGHLSAVVPEVCGKIVKAGTLIGYVGNTGATSKGAHLHFGVRPLPRDLHNGYKGWVNPLPLLLEGERAMSEITTAARWHSEEASRELETAIARQKEVVALAQQFLDTAQAQLVALRTVHARLVNEVTPRLYELEGH